MPQPTPYAPTTSFTDFQATNPLAPPPGYSLDAEFAGVEDTLGGVLANLALIQRDDGKLRNGIVDSDALDPLLSTQLKGLPGSPGEAYPTAAALALAGDTATNADDAYLSEAYRAGKFIFYDAIGFAAAYDGRSLVAVVAIDTQGGLVIPAAGDPTGASGAWVRQFAGPVDPRWFGLVPDTAVAAVINAGIFRTCMAATVALGLFDIQFRGDRDYWFGDNGAGAGIDVINENLRITGASAAGLGNNTCRLRFLPGIDGFRVQGSNTNGADGYDAVAHSSGAGSTLQHLHIIGGFPTSLTEGEFQGVRMRTKCNLLDLTIEDFEGDGIFGQASLSIKTSGANPPYGNINSSTVKRINISNCRDGTNIKGSDANAIVLEQISPTACRRLGLSDQSFLGNAYRGGTITSNGRSVYQDGIALPTSVCLFNNQSYYVIDGQAGWCSINPPTGAATGNQGWAYLGARDHSTPALLATLSALGWYVWFNGMQCRTGGAIYTTGSLNDSTFPGVYVEGDGDQGKAQLAQYSLVVGGNGARWIHDATAGATRGGSYVRGGPSGSVLMGPFAEVVSGSVTVRFGRSLGNTQNEIFRILHPTLAVTPFTVLFNGGGDMVFSTGGSVATAGMALVLTGNASTSAAFGAATYQNSAFSPRWLLPSSFGGNYNTAKPFFRAAARTVTYAAPGVTFGAPGTTYAAPAAATYVAPAGGATIDAPARASLAQLAADVASARASLVALAADVAAARASLNQAAADLTAERAALAKLAVDVADGFTKLQTAGHIT